MRGVIYCEPIRNQFYETKKNLLFYIFTKTPGNLEGEEFLVTLDGGVVVHAADETLGIEDGVLGVRGQLILGGITDQALALLGECNVRGGDTVT